MPKIVPFLNAAILLLRILSSSVAWAQCDCPGESLMGNTGHASIVYRLIGNRDIGICGAFERDGKDTVYSEFCLFECGKSEPIYEWGATESCTIKKKKDTIVIETFEQLPVGKNISFISTPFYVQQFFVTGNELKERKFYKADIRKYSAGEIKEVISKYNRLNSATRNADEIIVVSKMLFWAYVSGSKEAETYLNTIEKKFGPFDGGISEEWSDLVATYSHWKALR
ncbi:MAG: hypothetical protein V4649_16865 [Bacteroidota bacterium]